MNYDLFPVPPLFKTIKEQSGTDWEEMYKVFYPCETVVADSSRFKQAVKASAALMDTLSERLSKEDYALVEELREQVAIAQCEENESHFKYGFSAGLLVQQEAHAQMSQKNKE